ncbi:hypothetical protein ABZ820_34630 [Streptomyces diacarni]|uniref:DUF7426 family protein n=1 Tax=Streptomyces diacarni TaxID=2800381 RepID=UPI0033F7C125
MAAQFEAPDELFDEALELPVKGRVYRVPSPSAEDGLRVQRMAGVAAQVAAGAEPSESDTKVFSDDDERDLYAMCLGPAYDDMVADGVDWAWIKHAGLTAMMWITADLETAQHYWAAAGDPSQAAPNREARRAGRASSGTATSTRRRGSTSGTKAPARSAKKAAAKA